MREFALTLNNFIIEQKDRLVFILKIIFSIALLVYLYSMLEFDKILDALNKADHLLLGAAFMLLIPNLLLQFIKWKIVCASSLNEFDNKKIFTSLFLGFSGAVITPMRLGEIAGRIWGIRDKDAVKVTAAVFLDKIFTLMQTLLIGSLSAFIYAFIFLKIPFFYLQVFVIIAVLAVFLFLFILKIIRKKNFQVLNRLKFLSKTISVFEDMLKYKRRTALYLFIASFFFYLSYLMQFTFLVSAFTGKLLFFQYLWAASLILLVKTCLPISIGELGVRESASVFFLSLMGTQPSAAFNASIFLYLINVLIPALSGSLLLIRKK